MLYCLLWNLVYLFYYLSCHPLFLIANLSRKIARLFFYRSSLDLIYTKTTHRLAQIFLLLLLLFLCCHPMMSTLTVFFLIILFTIYTSSALVRARPERTPYRKILKISAFCFSFSRWNYFHHSFMKIPSLAFCYVTTHNGEST